MASPSPGLPTPPKRPDRWNVSASRACTTFGRRSAHCAPFRYWMTPGAGVMTMFWPSSALSAEGSAIRICACARLRAAAGRRRRQLIGVERRRAAAEQRAARQQQQPGTARLQHELPELQETRSPHAPLKMPAFPSHTVLRRAGRQCQRRARPSYWRTVPSPAGNDALRIAREVGDGLLDAVDRAAAVAHQRLDVAQALTGEARQPVGDRRPAANSACRRPA